MKQPGRPLALGQGKMGGSQPRKGIESCFPPLTNSPCCVPGPEQGSGEAVVVISCA